MDSLILKLRESLAEGKVVSVTLEEMQSVLDALQTEESWARKLFLGNEISLMYMGAGRGFSAEKLSEFPEEIKIQQTDTLITITFPSHTISRTGRIYPEGRQFELIADPMIRTISLSPEGYLFLFWMEITLQNSLGLSWRLLPRNYIAAQNWLEEIRNAS